MKIRKYLFGLMLLSVFFSLTACDDFVETTPPNSQLLTGAVFENSTTANAAMADVYAQMRDNGLLSGRSSGLSCLLGTYTDELTSFETGAYTTGDFYNNAVLPSNEHILSLWNSSYNQVYACNAIYEGVQQSTTLSSDQKSQLEGEAIFMRALIHFYLCGVFGDIPYITTTDYTFNSTVTRLPEDVVYQHIVADLQNAVALLPGNYFSQDRSRPNKAVAQALLARVYLYQGENALAVEMASSVLANTTDYTWEENLDYTFLKECPATIFQLASSISGANTNEAVTFIFYSGPPYMVSLSDDFVSQFEDGDLRRQHWIGEITDGSQIWYYPFKYKQDIPTSSSQEYSIILRTAEQYLIRAEALARQGELDAAKEDLNKIRHTAGLGDTPAVSQSEIMDAILSERRSELFTEHGHRFFDLKRFGKLDSLLGNKTGWDTTDRLWPLPLNELLLNPNLNPQNPGY